MANLSLRTRWRMFLAKSRSGLRSFREALGYLAGAQEHSVDVDVLHPDPKPSLCTCYGKHNAGREAYDDHKPECPWLAAQCRECGGGGWCPGCGGDGIARTEAP